MSLLTELLQMVGLVTPTAVPAVTIAVSSGRGDDAKGVGTPTEPFKTLARALEERRSRSRDQRVVIRIEAGDYPHAQALDLPANTVVEGTAGARPRITTSGAAAVVTIAGSATRPIRGVELENVVIAGGKDSGVHIRDADGVAIRGCSIVDNKAPRGGGVSVVDAVGIELRGNEVARNGARSPQPFRTLNIGWFPLVRKDARCYGPNRFGPGMDVLDLAVADGHGGGVYVRNSDRVVLEDNKIHDNTATLFGGGISVDNDEGRSDSIQISQNVIACNQTVHGAVTLPGLPEVDCAVDDLGDPVLDALKDETLDDIAVKAVKLLHGAGIENGLGGGIALRNVSNRVVVSRNIVGGAPSRGNRARRGGGIECFTGADPQLLGNTVTHNRCSDDGGGIAIDHFDPFLPAAEPARFGTTLRRRAGTPETLPRPAACPQGQRGQLQRVDGGRRRAVWHRCAAD